MSPELQSVVDELAKCGTADEVADLMRAAGVKGKPGVACECALSSYAKGCGVSEPVAYPYDDIDGFPTLSERSDGYDPYVDGELPPAAVSFAIKFDDGVYPDLIATP